MRFFAKGVDGVKRAIEAATPQQALERGKALATRLRMRLTVFGEQSGASKPNPSPAKKKRPAKPAKKKRPAKKRAPKKNPDGSALLSRVRVGSSVKIANRFGQVRSGRAVMRGPHGWVLNMGGKHGTPGIADESNIRAVRAAAKKRNGGKKKATKKRPAAKRNAGQFSRRKTKKAHKAFYPGEMKKREFKTSDSMRAELKAARKARGGANWWKGFSAAFGKDHKKGVKNPAAADKLRRLPASLLKVLLSAPASHMGGAEKSAVRAELARRGIKNPRKSKKGARRK